MEGFEGIRSIQPWTLVSPEEAPRAAKALYGRLAGHGWRVEILHAVTLRRATFYVGASEGHNMGDLRKPAHGVDHFALKARLDRQGHSVARLLATWAKERPAEGEKGKPVAFEDAHSWDVVTRDFEFHRTAGSMGEWLDILAPKPEKRAKPAAIVQDEHKAVKAELGGGIWRG